MSALDIARVDNQCIANRQTDRGTAAVRCNERHFRSPFHDEHGVHCGLCSVLRCVRQSLRYRGSFVMAIRCFVNSVNSVVIPSFTSFGFLALHLHRASLACRTRAEPARLRASRGNELHRPTPIRFDGPMAGGSVAEIFVG